MSAVVFKPRQLPASVAELVRTRLERAHRHEPFSVDPRETVRRVSSLLEDLPVATTVYRGGLDLRGVEVDHVWVGLESREDEDAPVCVVDAAFPLYHADFVALLRRFVVGEADAEDLAAAAARAALDQRVLGLFPPPVRYRGQPLWALRVRRGVGD